MTPKLYFICIASCPGYMSLRFISLLDMLFSIIQDITGICLDVNRGTFCCMLIEFVIEKRREFIYMSEVMY